MKSEFKKILLIVLILMLIFSLSSCLSKTETIYYVNTFDLTSKLLNDVTYEHGLYQISETKVKEVIGYDKLEVGIMFTGDSKYVDSFGVFKISEDGNIGELEEAINNYFKKLKKYYEPYKESEAKKLNETSIIQIKGDYLVFVISGDMNGANFIIDNTFVSKEVKLGEKAIFEEEDEANFVDTDLDTLLKDYYPSITSNEESKSYDSVLKIGDAAYEYIAYNESTSKNYAKCVSNVADELKGVSNVYDIVVPTSGAITLPDEYYGSFNSCNQKKGIYNISLMMSENVTFVNIYETLMCHRDEYIYFRTDHHWTMRGAYYAYEELLKKMNRIYYGLNNRTIDDYGDYLGLFYYSSCNEPEDMMNNPDTLYVIRPFSKAKMTFTDTSGEVISWPLIQSKGYYDISMKYISFIGGDNPITEIKSENVKDGSTLIIIKDSFGDIFTPLMVDHFENIYVIDFRYWKGNITNFAKEVNADDVVFINNMSMIRNSYLVGQLVDICFE